MPGGSGSPQPRPLLVVGAGGFGRETVEVVRAINALEPAWDLVGFVDDSPALEGSEIAGIPVVGPVASVGDHEEASVVVCTGHPRDYRSRKRVVTRLGLPPERFATLVHPQAALAGSAELGHGSVALATAVVTSSAVIGCHVVMMPGTVVTHDGRVGDFVTLASGARIAGRVTVCEGAYLGAGCLVREDLTIGAWALVGMGSVVLNDVGAGEIWAGVPARLLKAAPSLSENEPSVPSRSAPPS